MRTNTINMIPAGAISLGASATTGAFYVAQAFGYSIQIVWTGAPVGTFTLEVSNDAGPNEPYLTPTNPGVVNWSTYTGSAVAAGGGTGVWTWDVTLSSVRWVRLVYTRTSGTGSLTSVKLNPKG